jgi:outer membrane protein W
MQRYLFLPAILFLQAITLFSQTTLSERPASSDIGNPNYSFQTEETFNTWSLNLLFSDNGFGLGTTVFKQFNSNISAFGSIFVSGAKDEREFESIDIFGNSFIPSKVNRLYLIPLNLGLQVRLFKEDVTDNLRPYVNGGITPAAIIYTPYSESFFSSFNYAKAKYTVGAFAGAGVDYLTSKRSSLSLNVRYYYIDLFGEGIESLQNKAKTSFGGLYFVFSYNFMR